MAKELKVIPLSLKEANKFVCTANLKYIEYYI